MRRLSVMVPLSLFGIMVAVVLLLVSPHAVISQTINYTPWKVDTGYDWVATSTYTGGDTGWVNTAAVLPAAVTQGRTAVVGGYVYLFGGWRSGAALNTIYRASLSTPTVWASTGTTLPGAIYGQSVAVIGNYIYSFGGYNGSSWSRVIYRAPVSDPTTWTNTGALIPVGLSDPAIAIIGSYVYLFGGGIGVSTNTNAIYRASLADPLTWTTTAGTIPAALNFSHVAVIGNYVYLFGGLTSAGSSVNTIYRATTADPLTWTNTGSTLPAVASQGELAIIGDYVYIFAANNTAIYRAALATPTTWATTGSTIPAFLAKSHLALIGSNVYLFGGYNGSAATTVIYRAPLTLAVTAPTISTSAASSITTTSATANGSVSATGGAAATTCGFAWGTSASLAAGTATTTDSTCPGSTGAFTKSLTSLTPNTTYYFRAYATNTGGTGYGTIQSFTTAVPLPGAPGTPTFSSVTAGGLRISWTAATNATTYKLERCSGASCSSFSQIASGLATLYYDDTGLSSNTSYTYRVRATNATGDGAYSGTASQSTLLPPQPATGTGTAVTGWGWSDLIGWISMNCQTGGTASANICATRSYGVAIDSSGNLTGYAWSDAVGWIQFGGLSSFPSGTGTYSQNAAMSSTTVRGWARACNGTSTGDCGAMANRSDGWDGWISLKGSTYGPTLSGTSFTGYAWGGEAIGWIDFSRVSTSFQPCAASQGYMCVSGNSQHTLADCSISTDVCTSHGSDWFCSNTNGLCTAPPAPSVGTNPDGTNGTLRAKPNLVKTGQTAKLIWTITGATSCTVSGNGNTWTTTSSASGGNTSNPITQRTTYTLHCVSGGGALDETAIINIVPSWQER